MELRALALLHRGWRGATDSLTRRGLAVARRDRRGRMSGTNCATDLEGTEADEVRQQHRGGDDGGGPIDDLQNRRSSNQKSAENQLGGAARNHVGRRVCPRTRDDLWHHGSVRDA